MTRVHVGAERLQSSIDAYAKRFDLLEVRVGGKGAVAPATLRKWRKRVPPHFVFSVVVPEAASALRPGEALDADVEAVVEAVRLLEAQAIVIRTPVSVTPTRLSRDRLAALVERLPHDVVTIAWEPSGLWEAGDVLRAAGDARVVAVCDPARADEELADALSGPVAYARVRSLGTSRTPGEAALERVAMQLRSVARAFVIIESDHALKACRRLRDLVQRAKKLDGAIFPADGAMLVFPDEEG